MYSQDETVKAIHQFYLLLTKLSYIDDSWLRIPPPEGWSPELMSKAYEAFPDKNETVKSLLAHLPYLRTEPYGRANFLGEILVTYETHAIRYAVPSGLYSSFGAADRVCPLPAHCVYLTDGDRESTRLILDTERGTVTEMCRGTGLLQLIIPQEAYNLLPEEEKWKAFPTMPVREFFELWTRIYTRLVWMLSPASSRNGMPTEGRFHSRTTWPASAVRRLANSEGELSTWHPALDGLHEDLALQTRRAAAVYHTHLQYGWPDDFDKAGCRQALITLERGFDDENKRLREEEDERLRDEEDEQLRHGANRETGDIE